MTQAQSFSVRPKVYFEEWYDPLICGIRWVSELISIAGGEDCFAVKAKEASGRGRIIEHADEVVCQAPDIIIASWCGRKFNQKHMIERHGWEKIPAVRNHQLFEIKSADILQPGPAALSDGLSQLQQILVHWQPLDAC